MSALPRPPGGQGPLAARLAARKAAGAAAAAAIASAAAAAEAAPSAADPRLPVGVPTEIPPNYDAAATLCAVCSAVDSPPCCESDHRICAPCFRGYAHALRRQSPPLPCPAPGCCLSCAPPSDPALAGSAAGGAAAAPPRQPLARMERVPALDPKREQVLARFHASMPESEWAVTDIFRVVNPALQALFEAARERMDRKARGGRGAGEAAGERLLWHSTARAAAGAICQEGFDIRRAGSYAGTALGVGIYVAREARFSHHYSREDSTCKRCMLLCRTLLGTPGLDSKSDGARAPSQYVVGRECQVLPAFCLYYHRLRADAVDAAREK